MHRSGRRQFSVDLDADRKAAVHLENVQHPPGACPKIEDRLTGIDSEQLIEQGSNLSRIGRILSEFPPPPDVEIGPVGHAF